MPLISLAARYFDEVAKVGSIRRAADRLNISPSAINRQIMNLEFEYGVPLFERLPRGVRLTAAGEMLLERVRRWRHEQELAGRHLQELRGLRRGHVTIGLMECLATDFVPSMFAKIQSEHRGITFDSVVGGTEMIAHEIVAGSLDIAVAFNMREQREIKTVWSATEPIGLVMEPGHALSKHSVVKLSDCAGYPLILPGWSLTIRPVIENALETANIDIMSVVTSNSIALIKSAVRHRSGIAFLTRIDVGAELLSRRLVFRPIADRRMQPEILSLSVNASRVAVPAVALATETLKAGLSEMVACIKR